MTNDQYQILASELRDDLLDIGYSAMTAEAAAASLNEPRYSNCSISRVEVLGLPQVSPQHVEMARKMI